MHQIHRNGSNKWSNRVHENKIWRLEKKEGKAHSGARVPVASGEMRLDVDADDASGVFPRWWKCLRHAGEWGELICMNDEVVCFHERGRGAAGRSLATMSSGQGLGAKICCQKGSNKVSRRCAWARGGDGYRNLARSTKRGGGRGGLRRAKTSAWQRL
jgi:hypothetical protein